MPKKRSNGEGSIHRRPNGTWEWQIMIGYQDDGRRKLKSFYGKTQKEVKEKGKKYLDELNRKPAMNGRMPFSSWADVWYEGRKGQVSDRTYEGYQYTLALVKDYFKDIPLESIKPMTIEDFLAYLNQNGRSKSYIAKARGMLYGIMQKAEANDLIRRNPVALADKVKVDFSESHKDSFTAEEIIRLFQHLPDDRMGLSIRLLIGTGMRSQELLGLEPKHIESDGSVIHVRQAVTMTKGTPEIGPTKTRNSIRDIPVPSSLRKIAIELRNTDQKFIWHGETTPICNPSVFRKHFKNALRDVGGVRLLSPHACRHTYVSQLQAAGVELETIRTLSGHADIEMTTNYLHIQQQVRIDAAEKLDVLLKTVS